MSNKQWFQKLGFGHYPLDPRSNTDLIGVSEAESLLTTYIDQGNICLLCGYTGSGKTSMLQKLMKNQKLNGYNFLYISSDGIKKDKDINDLIKEKMSFFERLFLKKDKNMVILLDECQLASRILTESIKSKWNEMNANGSKKVHSVVISQIDPHLSSNFSGSFMDRLGKRSVSMKKLSCDELKQVLSKRLTNRHHNYIEKFEKIGLDFLIGCCQGSVRQLFEYSDCIFREIDRLDEESLINNDFKITRDHVFTFLQDSGLVVPDKNKFKKKFTFKKIFNDEKLLKAVEMFNEFGVMNIVLLAEKLDIPYKTSKTLIKNLLQEEAILISHTDENEKYYVLTPRMKHELVKD